MAQVQTTTGDVYVDGSLSARIIVLPVNTVNDASVIAATGIQATKLQHQYEQSYKQSFANTIAVDRQMIHWVKGATATIVEFRITATTAMVGNATAVIDLLKNGTSILTAQITLDSTTAAFAIKNPAGFTSTALLIGDFLEVNVVSVNAGTGTLAKGFSAELIVREDAQ